MFQTKVVEKIKKKKHFMFEHSFFSKIVTFIW